MIDNTITLVIYYEFVVLTAVYIIILYIYNTQEDANNKDIGHVFQPIRSLSGCTYITIVLL
jgi:hypothetical protein